jgi:hypothetical protein
MSDSKPIPVRIVAANGAVKIGVWIPFNQRTGKAQA